MDFLENPLNANWIVQKRFISKFAGPQYLEIFTVNNQVLKLVIYEGEIIYYHAIGRIIQSSRFRRFYVEVSPNKMQDPDLANLIGTFISLEIIKVKYEMHPYYVLKRPLAVEYIPGRNFEDFCDFLKTIEDQQHEMIFESDIQLTTKSD